MQLALAAGLTVSTAQGLFVEAVRAAPKKGGTFKMGIGHGSTTDSLDPATWENAFTIISVPVPSATCPAPWIRRTICALVGREFRAVERRREMGLQVAQGREFHNGKSVTADDVVANYNYHRKESSKSAVKSALSIIKDVKADGPDTVVFELNSGSADFPYVTSDYHLAISRPMATTISTGKKASAPAPSSWITSIRASP